MGRCACALLASLRNVTVTATNPEGKTYAVEAARGAGPSPPPAPGAPTPAAPAADGAEQKLWDLATTSKKRGDFQSYLLAYPNGAYVNRARDILLTCRTETRETWKETPFPANQAVRGVGSIPESGKTKAAACAAAKEMAKKQAKANCDAIASGGGYRSPQWTVDDRDCACQEASPLVTICIVDSPATCRWEAKIPEQVEICGG